MNTPIKSVLVITESPKPFAMAVSLLRAEGYEVTFSNGEHLASDVDTVPAMVISELAMPDIDGLKICRRLRRDKRMQQTPIMLVGDLSAYSSIVADGMRCGASAYVQKPFTFVGLASRVMDMLDSPPVRNAWAN